MASLHRQQSRQCIGIMSLLIVFLQTLSFTSTTKAFVPASIARTTVSHNNIAGNGIAARISSLSSLSSMRKPFFAEYSDVDTKNTNSNNLISSTQQQTNNKVGTGKTAIIAGATGYIGRAVVRECVARGYHTVSLVRNTTSAQLDDALFGSALVECDVTNDDEMRSVLESVAKGEHMLDVDATTVKEAPPVDLLVSCLASPSGIESEVYSIDYSATLSFLNAGRSNSVSARHFVLLSAFCVRNPLLKLQQAKLEFEAKLQEQTDMTYSIVRPTAFFKSVSGQLESIMDGNSYVLFGDGNVTQCNPIAEGDLAAYMCDCALESFEESRWGKVLNIGGPDEPLSNRALAECCIELDWKALISLTYSSQQMMFKAINKQPKFVYVPTQIFDYSISMIETIAKIFPSQKWEDALETAKIGKYYAVEDMLTTEANEKFGNVSMMDHFEKIAREGQDPFTPV
eukprot:scaffold1698_cov201-Alexandrium_tamarense.AAC.26